jgi:hypothetical protein
MKHDPLMIIITVAGTGWLVFALIGIQNNRLAGVFAFYFAALLLIRAVAILREKLN